MLLLYKVEQKKTRQHRLKKLVISCQTAQNKMNTKFVLSEAKLVKLTILTALYMLL